MKLFKTSLILIISLFSLLHSAVLVHDTFDGGLDGWSGTGLVAGTTQMTIPRDRTATKTFNLGIAYANTTISISFKSNVPNSWEEPPSSYADYLYVSINGSVVQTYTSEGGDIDKTFQATADAAGNITVSFNPDCTGDDEPAYIEDFTIEDLPVVPPSTFTCANPHPFVPVYKNEANSKLLLIGNTSLCADSNWDGICEDPGNATNNNINMIYNDYDDVIGTQNNGATTNNSSAAFLDMPNDKTVLFAALQWQGYMSGTWTDAQKATGANIKYKHDNDNYQVVTGAQMDWVYFSPTRMYYQGYLDITSYVNANKGGYYWVGDIATSQGQPTGGSFGAWSMVVVYQDENEVFSSISVYHGYEAFAGASDITAAANYASTNGCGTNTGVGNQVSSTLSGFLTPKQNTVKSTLTIFAGEGDIGIAGDGATLTDKSNVAHPISNTINPANNIMNATISVNNQHVMTGLPHDSNNSLGIDIDTYDVSNIIENEQSSTQITLSTTGDGYMPGMYALQTQLYVPRFCYDYAYSQYDQYFTEDYNATTSPRIVGSVNTSEPIAVKLYVKNLEASDVLAENMHISIIDIDTNQVKYKSDSTEVTVPGAIEKTPISDSILSIPSDNSAINNIPIGEVDGLEYFYTYYKLDPMVSDINTPINAKLDYNLTISTGVNTSVTIPYELFLSEPNFGICKESSVYDPGSGIFNVVHNDYYNLDAGGTSEYYNLPTQVTSREGNFKVLSMDVDDADTLKARSTIVAVEMIDASAFHDTNASCNDPSSSISNRVWVQIGDSNGEKTSTMFNQNALQTAIANGMTELDGGVPQLTRSANFYKNSRQNTAFRVSYNQTLDGNSSLVKIEPSSTYLGKYSINASELKQTVTTCASDMNGDSVLNDDVDYYCEESDDLDDKKIAICMECLYGYNTKFICSRDNFAIRPEAFLMHIDDQDQTVPSQPRSRLTTNYSGVAPATANLNLRTLNIAAGYNYIIDVNATNHVNNDASPGYTKSFYTALNEVDLAQYSWAPRSITPANAILNCNDRNDSAASNKSDISISFMNGRVDENSSVDEVGEYTLNILDTTWTRVDGDSQYMTHHNGNSYFAPGFDCAVGSTTTYPVNSTIDRSNKISTLTGCNISSSHTNIHPNTVQGAFATGTNLKYNDYNVTFHPYKFSVGNSVTIGLDDRSPTATNAFVYMNTLSPLASPVDENMSVHFNTTIIPQGENDTRLTNFVTGCYAKPIDINISKSDINNTVLVHRYIVHDRNSTTNNQINGFIDAAVNALPNANLGRDINATTPNSFFVKDMNGSLITRTNVNFDKNPAIVANPEDINFTLLTVTDPRTDISADLITDKNAEGNVTVNQVINHFYGRTAAKKTRIVCDPTAATCRSGVANGGAQPEPDVFIYYEIYCNSDTNTTGCNKDLIPSFADGRRLQRVDSRWFVNVDHNETADGILTATTDINPTVRVTVPVMSNSNDYTKDSQHIYDMSNGLPHTATMQSVTSPWLVYDENNPAQLQNRHMVIFSPDTSWTGENESDNTTNTDRVRRVNRRIMW